MLLVTGGLFLRSFAKLQSVNPGFEPRGVMTAMFWLPRESYRTPGEISVFYRSLLDRLKAAAGVTSAALGWSYPFSVFNNAGIFEIEGRLVPPGQLQPHADRFTVTPEYFTTLGIPLRRGRFFTDQDRINGERVAIIDENLAGQYWPGEDPLDKRIKREDQTFRIVGIVGHVLHSTLWSRSDRGTLYFNLFQQPSEAAGILVKATGDAGGMAAIIRDAIRNADPHQAVSSFGAMEDLVSNSLAPGRFAMRLLSFFAVAALLLAAIGLYGVISYAVEQRKREIGVRIALGAESRQVLRIVLGNGLRLASIGVLIGVIGSLAGMSVIRSQLYETSPFDPLTIAVVAIVLLATAALASYLPARRAMRVDPVIALRAE
jgi:predicted permease